MADARLSLLGAAWRSVYAFLPCTRLIGSGFGRGEYNEMLQNCEIHMHIFKLTNMTERCRLVGLVIFAQDLLF